jgi:hypothetical protein
MIERIILVVLGIALIFVGVSIGEFDPFLGTLLGIAGFGMASCNFAMCVWSENYVK